jgi:hypothetical protein
MAGFNVTYSWRFGWVDIEKYVCIIAWSWNTGTYYFEFMNMINASITKHTVMISNIKLFNE